MKILFTCGGTAGHVNPAVALARIFQERQPGSQVLFVGAKGGMEENPSISSRETQGVRAASSP